MVHRHEHIILCVYNEIVSIIATTIFHLAITDLL